MLGAARHIGEAAACRVGCMSLALASAICALVRPSTPPIARPGVAADQHRAALVARVERPHHDLGPGLVSLDGRLRESATCQPKCQIALCGADGGGASTLVEQDHHVVRRNERRQSRPSCRLRGARELPRVKADRRRQDRPNSDAGDGKPGVGSMSVRPEPQWSSTMRAPPPKANAPPPGRAPLSNRAAQKYPKGSPVPLFFLFFAGNLQVIPAASWRRLGAA